MVDYMSDKDIVEWDRITVESMHRSADKWTGSAESKAAMHAAADRYARHAAEDAAYRAAKRRFG